MKHISTILMLCMPLGVIAGLWSGLADEGTKVLITGLVLGAIGTFMKMEGICEEVRTDYL